MNLSEIIEDIAKKYELDSIGIFGSRARGDYRQDSDLDIFIIGNLTLDDELSLEAELEQVLKISVDIVRISQGSDKMLLKNIINDASVIYSKNNSFENLYKFVEQFFIENSDFIHIRKVDLLD